MHFYWQSLIILFADDRAKKYAITAVSVSGKEKYISGAEIWRGSAVRSWLSYPTLLISFSPIWLNASGGCDDIIARNEKKVKV